MSADPLPHALADRGWLDSALDGRRPAVFLDYDGVLTPIVERPEDAVMAPAMRETVRALAGRCPVCVVSGRDRAVVQELMGVTDLVVAGSHGFDIWHPERGTLQHPAAAGHEPLVAEVRERLEAELAGLDGVELEAKRASVAVHYRRAAPRSRELVTRAVRALLAERPEELKLTPGKMVYELQPKIDWHKGAAVRYLLDTLNLRGGATAPVYLGDDVTDEDAFRAVRGDGVGIYVGDPADLERETAAAFWLASVAQVQTFLETVAR